MSDPFRLATRSSDLALRQAGTVRDAIESRRQAVELLHVETHGDRIRDEMISRLGKTGAFVRALDERVLSGEADAAVHSMKDVPTEMPDDLVFGGVPERAPPGDALVTPDGGGIDDLLIGATVGTSSLRRKAQLLAERPDLNVEPLRGNVDTRVQKLIAPKLQSEHETRLAAEEGDDDVDEEFDRTPEEWFDDLTELERGALEQNPDTEYDAIVLAESGLRRSDLWDHSAYETERLPRSTFVPAPGQGALAVTTATQAATDRVRNAVDHPPTRVTTTVERTILDELGGGCIAPIGIHALLQGEYVAARVRVLSADGSEEIAASRDLPAENHARAAREFAEDLREDGAAELIEEAKRENAPDDEAGPKP